METQFDPLLITLCVLVAILAVIIITKAQASRVRRADEILGQSEEKFRHLVNAVKDYAILMLDLDGRITTWNSGAERISGFREDEVLGKHVSMFYTQPDIDNRTTSMELKTASETGHFEGEGMRRRKDGTVYWASIVISPLYGLDGTITGYSKVTRDITLVKDAEMRLHQLVEERTRDLARREHQLSSITNAVPALIAQIDTEERVLFANDAFSNWFRTSSDQLTGKTFREILGEERYPFNQPHIQKALAGEIATYERNGSGFDRSAILSVTLVPEFNPLGQVTGFIVLANDITRYKEIEEELLLAKEAAEVANATKSAFLANMSHEIRTPLGVVLGLSELLMSTEMSASEKANSIQVIKRNGNLLSNIINDILDLSKVEAGRLQIERAPVSFADLMAEIGSTLQFEASEKGIELKFTADGMVPDQILTDPLRLRQILLNIIGNAIKFTGRGSVEVEVRLTAAGTDEAKLAFVVKDTGEGIHPEQVKRLFTPFMQADASTTRRFGGTGLGLVLSKKLANALGGDVVLTSTKPGEGSVFTITIDPGRTKSVLFQSSDNMPGNLFALPKLDMRKSLTSLRVLLADDSPDNQLLIRNILRLAGATVEAASNGREAVEMALNGDYHVVLMDLQMPTMDGYEATRMLRQRGYQGPIIALTAHAMKEERQRTLGSGFTDHITKPIDREHLIKVLAEYPAS